MIDRIIEFSLKNRFLILAAYALLAGWGYWALLHTPIDAIPDLSDNQVIVFSDWLGRSPQEVEDPVPSRIHSRGEGRPGNRRLCRRRCSDARHSAPPAQFREVRQLPGGKQRLHQRRLKTVEAENHDLAGGGHAGRGISGEWRNVRMRKCRMRSSRHSTLEHLLIASTVIPAILRRAA